MFFTDDFFKLKDVVLSFLLHIKRREFQKWDFWSYTYYYIPFVVLSSSSREQGRCPLPATHAIRNVQRERLEEDNGPRPYFDYNKEQSIVHRAAYFDNNEEQSIVHTSTTTRKNRLFNTISVLLSIVQHTPESRSPLLLR